MDDDAQPRPGRRWTEKLVIAKLGELFRRGVPLTLAGLRAAGEQRLFHIINHHGGLPRLRRIAGLPRPRKGWQRSSLSADGVLREIRLRHEHGQPLAWREIPAPLQHAAQQHFGSWYAAITAAGLDFDGAVTSPAGGRRGSSRRESR